MITADKEEGGQQKVQRPTHPVSPSHLSHKENKYIHMTIQKYKPSQN